MSEKHYDGEISPTLFEFIKRRTNRFFNRYQSLEIILAGAYLQGMNDALDATRYFEEKTHE